MATKTVANENMSRSERDRIAAPTKNENAATVRSDVVIVANRFPVQKDDQAEGGWKASPGGLVSALEPVLSERDCAWVGWYDGDEPLNAPVRVGNMNAIPVSLTADELENYYEGFSNGTLWPLYHGAIRPGEFHRHWWRPYVSVNAKFATIAADAVAENGIVWVHDYQLQLVPGMLRELRPDVRIGFFLHIPFPPRELFRRLPWRKKILEGLLGADVVGFQRSLGAENFAQLSRKITGAQGARSSLDYHGRKVHVGPFPISIDFARYEGLAKKPEVAEQAKQFRKNMSGNRKVLLGVDRLDYTKGIDARLKAFRDLLRSDKNLVNECVFVQLAVPSREQVPEYKKMRATIERLVGEINGEFGELGQTPVHYFRRSLAPEELVALYKIADVMVVTPFQDGMNLVAKEYVASRTDNSGVLILSEFAGSADELNSAIKVNPHDVDGMTEAMRTALHMPAAEQKRKMSAMRRVVKRNDVFNWANRFFETLSAV